jgi:hypothetical protein
MDGWITFSNQNLPLTLRYPNPTPRGHPVRIREYSTDSSYRAHLTSESSDEVYFEVAEYLGLPVHQAIERFMQDVSERIDNLETSQVEEVRFASFPAYQFSIHWPGKERVILFVEKGAALYRIIHDPSSPLNRAILTSFSFL